MEHSDRGVNGCRKPRIFDDEFFRPLAAIDVQV
jgi:hypothetical protein